jgi:predicted DNA-binding transcriptional regulator YafY
VVYPYLLKEFRNRWFLFGSQVEDLLLYNLALDRIISIEKTDIPYQENPNFDSATFFDDMIGVSKDINDKPKEITFLATEKQSKYIETKPLHKSQKLLNRDIDGYCTFSINVVLNFELYSVLMSYGSGIKILSPKRVERYMKRMSEQMYDLYH